jgi:hypothetical protein
MTQVDIRNTVTLKQAADLILACPTNRFMLQGEPGIGKSSIIKMLQERTGYAACYIDVPNMDLGDIAMPIIDHETKTTRYYPNARFQFHLNKPVIVMLDEFSKGADPVKNMLHPLLEVMNPRLGDVPVPKGSIIFMTGNLASDGVGDGLKAHTKMRISTVETSKPSSREWLEWAANNDIAPVVMAWVDQHPYALASYREGDQQGNPFIFIPNTVQGAVVTPRTLELASNIVKQRHSFDGLALHASLVGTIGAAAATSLSSFIAHQDSLPAWQDIVTDPKRTPLPKEQGAIAVLVYGAIERVTKDTLPALLEYMSRIEEEWQIVLGLGLARSKSKQSMAFTCKAFAEWTLKNEDLL